MGFMYKVARASEVLAITGYNLKDVKLARKAWIFPGQRYTALDITPVHYTLVIQAVSAEKLPFLTPAVFTIGPRHEDKESLLRYAKLLSPHGRVSQHVRDLVQGVIEVETGVLAATKSLEDILKETTEFMQELFGKVQLALDQFGLLLYVANVKQLVDVAGHGCVSLVRSKMQQDAENRFKLNMESRKKGEIGDRVRNGQNAAKIDAKTSAHSTRREGEGKTEEINMRTEVNVYEDRRDAEFAVAEEPADRGTSDWGTSCHGTSDCGTSGWAASSYGTSDCGNSGTSDCGTSTCGMSSSMDNNW